MSDKLLPLSPEQLAKIDEKYGTPFHLYIEKDIRANARRLNAAFAWAPSFKEYFAVKALPNPYIVKILAEEGFGADCSSLAELVISEAVGLRGNDICFTSNDTPIREYQKALQLDAVINLDDITHIEFLERGAYLPQTISFRYNPGKLRGGGNTIIGYPEEAKYGLTRQQLFAAIGQCHDKGIKHFGLHTMIVSNELNGEYFVDTARMMFQLAVEIKQELNIDIEFINLGGGIGIPYHPQQEAVNLEKVGEGIRQVYQQILVAAGLDAVKLCIESGRMITGPYGYLVTKVLHRKDTYKNYIGVDACMADLMRPALYGAYHHITVAGKERQPADYIYDITGSLCENNDKFAIDRRLPKIEIGDLLVIHDTGAHGHAMGFNYNGKLRSKELLLKENGEIQLIRRAETLDDYFVTLDFPGLKQT